MGGYIVVLGPAGGAGSRTSDTAIAFDPVRQADQIRKQGGFIPGIRPGPQIDELPGQGAFRIALPGALFIAVIAVLPVIMLDRVRRAGTSRSPAPPS